MIPAGSCFVFWDGWVMVGQPPINIHQGTRIVEYGLYNVIHAEDREGCSHVQPFKIF